MAKNQGQGHQNQGHNQGHNQGAQGHNQGQGTQSGQTHDQGQGKQDQGGSSSFPQQAKDIASSVKDKAREAGTAVSEKAQNLMEGAKDRMSHLGENAGEGIKQVGGQMRTLAGRLREQGPHEGTWGSASEAVASTLESGGNYLEQHDFRAMAEDLSGVVKNHPMPALLACVGLGFLLGRSLRS